VDIRSIYWVFSVVQYVGVAEKFLKNKGHDSIKNWELKKPFFSFTSQDSEKKLFLPLDASQRPLENKFTFHVARDFSRCCRNYCVIQLRTGFFKHALKGKIQKQDGQTRPKTGSKT
jgi:hypothetical protein